MKKEAASIPMIPNKQMTRAGLLPVRGSEVRFAVGNPNSLTSNSWLVKAKKGSIYIICRDNFREAKVSLHPQGGWRMAFTTDAIKKNPRLAPIDKSRDWAVWDEPPATLPKTVVAFHLYFPTSELAVSPGQRASSKWKDTIYIEAGPPGKMTIITLFITIGELNLVHESEPSFVLASLDIGSDRFAQLVAHGDPEATIPEMIERSVVQARKQAEMNGVEIPREAYAYFFGHRENGARFLVGARMNRTSGGDSAPN